MEGAGTRKKPGTGEERLLRGGNATLKREDL